MSDATDDLDYELSGERAWFRNADKKHWEEQKKRMAMSKDNQPTLAMTKDLREQALVELRGWIERNHLEPFDESDRWCLASREIIEKIDELLAPQTNNEKEA